MTHIALLGDSIFDNGRYTIIRWWEVRRLTSTLSERALKQLRFLLSQVLGEIASAALIGLPVRGQIVSRCPLCQHDAIESRGWRSKQAHDSSHDWIRYRRAQYQNCGATVTFLPAFSLLFTGLAIPVILPSPNL